jgi:hypothetical protein
VRESGTESNELRSRRGSDEGSSPEQDERAHGETNTALGLWKMESSQRRLKGEEGS